MNERQATSDTGPVEFGPGDRYRGHATSMDYSGVDGTIRLAWRFWIIPTTRDIPRRGTSFAAP